MSRFTWLKAVDVAAVCGMSPAAARRLTASLDKTHWSFQHARVQASKLAEKYERDSQPLPPLLLALMTDEREYPTWLAELRHEYRRARELQKLNFRKKKRARVEMAQTHEEALRVLESLPDIEARGYLEDEGLPPEYRMDDRLGLARGDEDDDG